MNKYLKACLNEAYKAFNKFEVPVGCIIVDNNGKIVSRAHNLRETKQNSLAHAEIMAINKACKKLNSWRLRDCEMYVTLEPCVMCTGAIIQAQLKKVHFFALDKRNGSIVSNNNLLDANYTHKVLYEYTYYEECSKVMSDFFKLLRERKKD